MDANGTELHKGPDLGKAQLSSLSWIEPTVSLIPDATALFEQYANVGLDSGGCNGHCACSKQAKQLFNHSTGLRISDV